MEGSEAFDNQIHPGSSPESVADTLGDVEHVP